MPRLPTASLLEDEDDGGGCKDRDCEPVGFEGLSEVEVEVEVEV